MDKAFENPDQFSKDMSEALGLGARGCPLCGARGRFFVFAALLLRYEAPRSDNDGLNPNVNRVDET